MVAIIIWDCIPHDLAKHCFLQLSQILGRYGIHMARNCEFNQELNCLCNGTEKQGASVTLGCSYQGLVNSCKFKVMELFD